MDLRRADEVHPGVTFDLFKVWLAHAHGRQVADEQPHYSGWQAMALALQQAAREYEQQCISFGGHIPSASALSLTLTEQELRLRTVAAYRAQDPKVLEKLIAAKVDDPWSFFWKMGWDIIAAKTHWPWYLWCLSCDPSSRPQEQSLAYVNVPLDSVDLQVVATCFRTQIRISTVMDESTFIEPAAEPQASVHLLMHRWCLWAPLLDSRPPTEEVTHLVGAVVELGDFASQELHKFNNQYACVLHFDSKEDCYVVSTIDNIKFPVDRKNIMRIVFQVRESNGEYVYQSAENPNTETVASKPAADADQPREAFKTGSTANVAENLKHGQAPPLRGIPDGALEFQVLYEKVRRLARNRLESMNQELAGRTAGSAASCSGPGRRETHRRYDPLPTPARNDSSRSQQQTQQQRQPHRPELALLQSHRRLPSGYQLLRVPDEVQTLVGCSIVAPVKHEAPQGSSSELSVEKNECLKLIRESNPYICVSNPSSAKGWILKEKLIVYGIAKAFTPQADWGTEYLQLCVDDLVFVQSRYDGDWAGWCYGIKNMGDEKGLFHVSSLGSQFFLSRT